MKIFISGANSPLGQYLKKRLRLILNSEIYEGSSRPNSNQTEFNIYKQFNFHKIENIDVLIHLACPKNPNEEGLKKELNLLKNFREKGISIINIGSVSGCREKPNNYGIYKKEVENWCTANKETNLRCGLLFGEDFFGQLFRINRILKYVPIYPVISLSGQVLLTPVEFVLENIVSRIKFKKNEFDLNPLLTGNIFFNFNEIVRDLSGKNSFKLNLNFDKVRDLLNFFKIPGKYSSDRFLGVTGNFNVKCLGNKYEISDSILKQTWNNYISELKNKL